MQDSTQQLKVCTSKALKNGNNDRFKICPGKGCTLQCPGVATELVAWRSFSASPSGEVKVTSRTILLSSWFDLTLLLGSGKNFLCLASVVARK